VDNHPEVGGLLFNPCDSRNKSLQGYFAMLVSPAADQDAKRSLGTKAIRDLKQDVRGFRGDH